jgi:hypothetical protein
MKKGGHWPPLRKRCDAACGYAGDLRARVAGWLSPVRFISFTVAQVRQERKSPAGGRPSGSIPEVRTGGPAKNDLRKRRTIPTVSRPMIRMHLNAYVLPAARKAVGTSRCLWIETFDPRSGE